MNNIKILSKLLIPSIVFIILTAFINACSYISVPPMSDKADSYISAPGSRVRDIAFRRAVWHSSVCNYDNTGQLITDGIIGLLSNEVIDYSGTSGSNPTYGQMIPGKINSEWISESNGKEWVYIDLGMLSTLKSITIYWGVNYAREYEIQVSDDVKAWQTVTHARGASNRAVKTKLMNSQSRFLRILCNTSSGTNYIIREVKIFGINNLKYRIADRPSPQSDGSQKLTGGNWTIQRASLVKAGGRKLSKARYNDSKWLPATVPGTAFVSYLNAGAVPDPFYDDWQFQVSDIFFTADFWYRNSFEIPTSQKEKKVYLNFDAVNWKADVWFNGHFLANNQPGYSHSIEGAFIRAKFDITALANFGGQNYLAVLIHRNRTPGLVTTQGLAEGPLPNGGELGQDNPAIHAAVGWDWLPTIRGRDIGIYNDVTLTYGGSVQLENPWMETDLNITETSANISAKNLAIGKEVSQPSTQTAANLNFLNDDDVNSQWIGEDIDGAGFTIDLGEITSINSLQLIWEVKPVVPLPQQKTGILQNSRCMCPMTVSSGKILIFIPEAMWIQGGSESYRQTLFLAQMNIQDLIYQTRFQGL